MVSILYLRKIFEYEYDVKEADVALLGVPFDSTETGLPVRFGLMFIREAIRNLTGWNPRAGKNIFKSLRFADIGDVEAVPGSWPLTKERVSDTLRWLMEENPKILPAVLGGEHLVTLGVLESLQGILDRKITVVHFDAHRDLMPDWMGNPESHITWACHALKKGFELVQIGCRSYNKEEENMLPLVKGPDELGKIRGPVYLTVDLDVFDPSYAPEVGTPEPQGLSPGDFAGFLDRIDLRELAGFDVVECASQRVGTQTALLGAWVFREVIERWKR